MLKQACRSYLASLHPRNIKKVKSTNAFWLVYWIFVWPGLMGSTNEEVGADLFYLSTKMIPFLIMTWSNISSRYLMTKQMFIAPMKKEDREKYVNYVLYLKIGFPVCIGFLMEMMYSCLLGFNWYRTFVQIFIYLSVGIAMYVCIDGTGWADRNITWGRRGADGKMKWAFMNMTTFVWGLLALAGLEANDIPAQMDILANILVNGGLLVFAIFNILIIRNQYKDVIEHASNYEASFRILGKVPEVKYDLFAK